MPVDLSVVIPAYNEGRRLEATLRRIVGFLENREGTFEVIVVDDGSADRTAEVAENFEGPVYLLRLARNRGKGAALRHGVVASSGAAVLLTDADLSTPIEEVEKLAPYLARSELVLGSRAVAGADIQERQSRHRELLGKTFNLFIRCLGAGPIRDTQCGFKLIRGEVARELFPLLRIDRFAYDVELVFEARRKGYRIAEVGVEWSDAPFSRVRPFRDGFQMVGDVLRMRLGRR
jgi:dolichyl-phosphate beta-glucosyltransferase